MRISDWSSDVCSSDLQRAMTQVQAVEGADADHTAVGAQGPAFDVAEQLVHRFSVIGMPGRRAAWLSARAAEAAGLCRTREVTARATRLRRPCRDRTSVVSGRSVSVRVDLGGRR